MAPSELVPPLTLTNSQETSWSLLEHITLALTRPKMGDSKAPTQWPSEASAAVVNDYGELEVLGSCRRRAYFRLLVDTNAHSPQALTPELQALSAQLKEEKSAPRDEMLFIWAQGELYEKYVIEQAMLTGVFVSTQSPVYLPGYNLSGKLDLVAIDPETGLLTIAECKSVHGRGGEKALGSVANRNKGLLGVPKDSNLMQIALYDWHVKATWPNPEHWGDSRLLYGDRGTGMHAEYLVRTVPDKEHVARVYYKPLSAKGKWVEAPFTIGQILEAYKYIADHLASNTVPPRDFKAEYSIEDLAKAYERDLLTRKADREQWESYSARVKLNEERAAEGLSPKVNIKPPSVADFACTYCDFAKTCSKVN